MTYVSRDIIKGIYPIPEPRKLTFYVQRGHVRDQLIFQLAAKNEEHVAIPMITFLRKVGAKKLDEFQYIEFDLAEYNTLISVNTTNPSHIGYRCTIEHLHEPPPDSLKPTSWLKWLGLKS
jgi:hypothetical protein